MLGGFAETVVAPEHFVFPLDGLDFAQGAGSSSTTTRRTSHSRCGAATRPARACSSRARLAGSARPPCRWPRASARVIGVVSTDDKERFAREAGADDVVRSDGRWKDEVEELSGGGVDIVIDPVGGERFTTTCALLREGGRCVVVGFTGGSIPEVRVNRLLLNNIDVVGAGWGAYVVSKPDVTRSIGSEIGLLAAEGFVRPIVGARFPLSDAADALELLDSRGATGKVVLEVR